VYILILKTAYRATDRREGRASGGEGAEKKPFCPFTWYQDKRWLLLFIELIRPALFCFMIRIAVSWRYALTCPYDYSNM